MAIRVTDWNPFLVRRLTPRDRRAISGRAQMFARRWPLLLNLILPRFNPYMSTAIIDVVYPKVGDAITIGGKLMDVTIDLSAMAPHDCPPISYYRLIGRDRVWLRRLDVAVGGEPEVGASLALFSTEPDEELDSAPAREIRVSIAGIMGRQAWPQF